MTRRAVLLALWPDILQPKLVYQARPVYPKVARDARIEGIVLLSVLIDEEGNVASLRLISGHPFLVKAAMDAVRRWRWLPMRILGEPVSFRANIDVPFRLNQADR